MVHLLPLLLSKDNWWLGLHLVQKSFRWHFWSKLLWCHFELQRCVFLFITIVIVLYRRLITPVTSLNNGWPTLRCPWVRSELHRKMILFHWDYSNRGWDQNHVVTVAFSEFMFSCNWCINPKFSVSPYLTSRQRQLLRSLRECQRLVYIVPLLQSK